MLAIRMQRTGRKGHAQFRLIVQEARRSPKSGNIVVSLGNYDPHSKATSIDKEKAAFYLEHGAQPSSRVAMLLQKEGVKLPKWVKIDQTKKQVIKNTDKLRRNRPDEETPAEEPVVEAETTEVTEAPEVAEAEAEAPEAEAETPTETEEA